MNSNDNAAVTNQLPLDAEFEGDEKNFRGALTQTYRKIANTVNTKTGGLFIPSETANSEQYFTDGNPQQLRNVYRMTVDFGPLPNATTKSVPHNISFTSEATATRIYGEASSSSTGQFIPLPYASATGNHIELLITSGTVDIITTSDRTAFDTTYVVIEYCKTQ